MANHWENLCLLAEVAYSLSKETNRKKRKKPDTEMIPVPESIPKKRRTTMSRKPRRRRNNSNRMEMPGSLRARVVGELGGDEVRLAIEKALRNTDVSRGHGRLSMPGLVLSDDEASRVKEGLEVLVVDENLREYSLRLKQWKMGNTQICNLTKAWNSVVHHNTLHLNDVVQLWSFRRQSQLCFALVNLTRHSPYFVH